MLGLPFEFNSAYRLCCVVFCSSIAWLSLVWAGDDSDSGDGGGGGCCVSQPRQATSRYSLRAQKLEINNKRFCFFKQAGRQASKQSS